MVLGVVFLTLGAVIKQAYVLHDEVTGSMILEETLERARCNRDEKKDEDYFKRQGEQEGNPRLWLGAYEVELRMDGATILGNARAGDWELQMEMKRFEPETFLRRIEAIRALGKEQDDSGN